MEHYAKHSSDDPQIRVLPDGFAEPGRRRIRRLDNSGWAYLGFGAVTLGLLIPLVVVLVISLFVNGLKNPLTSNEVLMCLGLFVLLLPYLIGPVWYGWFVVSRPEFDFSDPMELLRTEGFTGLTDRLTILRRSFLGTDSAIFLDNRNDLVHFFNCHVANGFIPRVMRVYTCKTDSLRYHEATYSTEDGSITKGTLTSSDGSTTLPIIEPGVIEFLELVRKPT
jgi:hypothetical protein